MAAFENKWRKYNPDRSEEQALDNEIRRLGALSVSSNIPPEFYDACTAVVNGFGRKYQSNSDLVTNIFGESLHLPEPLQETSLYALTYAEAMALCQISSNPNANHRLSKVEIDFLLYRRAEFLQQARNPKRGMLLKMGYGIMQLVTGAETKRYEDCLWTESLVERACSLPETTERIRALARS